MTVDNSPWVMSSLPNSGSGREDHSTAMGSELPVQASTTAASARELLLASLHAEAAKLRQDLRLGVLSETDRAYLADLQREIDHHETLRPSLRDGDLWRRIDALAETILAARK